MKKYMLVSKDSINGNFTLYESNDYKFILCKYNLWKSILPKTNFCIFVKIESVN